MPRIVIATLISLAVAAAAAPAAASAHQYRVGGEPIAEGASVWLSATESVESQEFSGTPFGFAVHFLCGRLTVSGELRSAGTGSGTLELNSCTVTKPANCSLKTPILMKARWTLVGPSPGVELELGPEVGEELVTLTLEGASCSLKEPFTISGTQTCALPESEVEASAHEVLCATTGSRLKMGGKAMTFKGGVKSLVVAGEASWSAV
jgi:hypothetical protein